MRGGVGLVAVLVVVPASTGCELLADRSATVMDAGPDAVAASCFTAAGCVECEPLTASPCPASADAAAVDGGADASAPCPGGGDCDAIPDGRDPWPTRCNALQLDESFAAMDEERWGRSYNDLFIGVRSCGLLQWTAPPNFTIWAWVDPQAAAGLHADALAEVRVIPPRRGSWSLTLGVNATDSSISSGASGTLGRFCALTYRDDGAVLTSRIYTKGSSSHESKGSYPLDGGFVLQSWREGATHHCRVVPDEGTPFAVEGEIKGPLAEPGTVKLTLSNNAAQAPYVWLWIDWLRVFAP